MELLLSVLTNPGPVFRNNEVFISLVKKDLCLPLSKSGISPNRTSEKARYDEPIGNRRNSIDTIAKPSFEHRYVQRLCLSCRCLSF